MDTFRTMNTKLKASDHMALTPYAAIRMLRGEGIYQCPWCGLTAFWNDGIGELAGDAIRCHCDKHLIVEEY